MRRILMVVAICGLILPSPAPAQSTSDTKSFKALLTQYVELRSSLSAQSRREFDQKIATLGALYGLSVNFDSEATSSRRSVGRLSANPYIPGSTSSSLSAYDALSPVNPYGVFGSPYSPQGSRNPYAVDGLNIYGEDGTYLGRLNSNRYDPNSVANPYGEYGSTFSPTSINNPYSIYGSLYSPYSAQNPYAVSPPTLYAPSGVLQPLAPSRTALPALPSLPTLPRLPGLKRR